MPGQVPPLLTESQGGVCLEGGCLPGGGVCLEGGVPGQVPPPVNRITDTCKNITLAKTSFRPVNSLTTI